MAFHLGLLVAGIALTAAVPGAIAKDFHPCRQIERWEAVPFRGLRRGGEGLAILGQRLFYDPRLSATGRTACASCHDPTYAFADPGRVSISDTGRAGQRNAPSLFNSGLQRALMWDGRFRSLEQQALSPFRRGEMGISVNEALNRINCDREYAHAFDVVFGTRPTAQAMARALAGYVRTLVSRASRFDRFLFDGARTLTPIERDGWSIFNSKAACNNCHRLFRRRFGQTAEALPLFTDFAFHNLGIGSLGRRFVDAGRYGVTGNKADLGAFRTPSLRNVGITAPYMHDGSLATLEEVIAFYDAGGRPNPNLSPLIRPLFLDDYEKDALVAFLRTLTDPEYDVFRLRTQHRGSVR